MTDNIKATVDTVLRLEGERTAMLQTSGTRAADLMSVERRLALASPILARAVESLTAENERLRRELSDARQCEAILSEYATPGYSL